MRVILACLGLLACGPAGGETLRVGPGLPLDTLAAAAARARDGDTIEILPGTYGCAVWRASDILIRAVPGGEVEVTGPVCQGKGLFVVAGARVAIEGLTFRGARAEPGNGAGIRAEGASLTIRRSRFIDNENGILTANRTDATIEIEDSRFTANGALVRECAHGLYAGRIAQVSIRRTVFEETRICHHVKSRARLTEIRDSTIRDGGGGRASYLVDIPNGGGLLLTGTTLTKGPLTGNRTAAVVIGAEGATNAAAPIEITGNRMTNLIGQPTAFVRNLTTTPAQLAGNRLAGPLVTLEGPGEVRP
jgi:hypothetical protein